jgi:enoyl-CoA hydratase/carnithine racemase
VKRGAPPHCRGCGRVASREFPVSLGTVPTARSHVELERHDVVARLVLNRPERRNALSQEVMVEMLHALDTIAADETTRVLVIEGRGPAFSAGHDLAEMTANRGADFYQELFATCVRLMTRVHELPQPVIAKVQGVATAAGCQLVAACDLAIASDDARFATPGVNIGLFCSTPMVPVARSIGRKRALEMLFTGEMIDARTALEWGLVNRVVAADRLDHEVDELARRIASASAYVLALGKRAFYAQDQLPEDGAYEIACEVMIDNAQADDAHAGMRAFLEKRAPQWRNR